MAKEIQMKMAMCNVVLAFKNILLFIYELIHVLFGKISGINSAGKRTGTNAAFIKSSVKTDETGNNNAGKGKKLKGVSEIPGPRTLPFFGTLLTSSGLKCGDLLKDNEDWEREYGTVVKEEYYWNVPIVMILDGEDIKTIKKDNPIYRPPMEILLKYRSLRPQNYNTNGLVNSQGETWKMCHNTVATVTTNMEFVRSLLTTFDDISTDLLESFAKGAARTEPLKDLMTKFILESSFYIAYGKRMGYVGTWHAKSDEWQKFWDCHNQYWKSFHLSMEGFPWWKYFSTKSWKDFTAAEDKLINTVDEMTQELLESGKAGGVLAELPLNKVLRQDLNVFMLELITGATEPVIHTLIFTMYYISKHEHVYQRVLEELKVQLPNKDSIVDEKVLENIPYLKACIMESLRCVPTACNVARVLEKEVIVGNGEYRLPENTMVVLQKWHASLKDSNFYRAKEFLPERWIFKDGIPPFKPHERQVMCEFGVGTRSCPGRRIAAQLMQTFLAKLFRRFRVKFPNDLVIRYEWLLVAKEPIDVEFIENNA